MQQRVTSYNDKGVLTRVFLSPSWGLGYCVGQMHNVVVGQKETVETQFDAKKVAENGSLFVAGMLIAAFDRTGLELASEMRNGLKYIPALPIVADALTVGSGEVMGAMRAGYAEAKIGGIPVDPS